MMLGLGTSQSEAARHNGVAQQVIGSRARQEPEHCRQQNK